MSAAPKVLMDQWNVIITVSWNTRSGGARQATNMNQPKFPVDILPSEVLIWALKDIRRTTGQTDIHEPLVILFYHAERDLPRKDLP